MKSSKLLLTTIFLFVLGFAQAQNDYNPFKKYGYTPPKPLTLSNGKYQEFFDNDTIVQIGNVMFNTVTNQVVAFVEYDTAYSEATLEPYVISRWLSPDPLADEFPGWSPYNFVENNPIKNIDPDGRFPIDIIADLAFIGYDLYDMAKTKMSGGNISGTQYAALGADALGALIPYATGLGAAVRAEKVATKIVTETAEQVEKKVVKSIAKEGDAVATTVYKRPSNATTKAQREAVQGKPCVDCGKSEAKMVADHKKPLVKEHYETGTIDKKKMRDVESVQPQCPTCSSKQGAEMSKYSKEQKKIIQPK